MTSIAVCVRASVGNLLGEGTLWHPPTRSLFWFDILRSEIFRLNPDGSVARHRLEHQGSAAAWIDAGNLLVATADGICHYDIDSGKLTRLHALEPSLPQNRSNDGRCDPWGRFWIGTMARNAADKTGSIYIYDGTGAARRVRGGLGIPNSIAFAPDRRRAYYADSAEQTIFALDLDPSTGAIIDESVFATTAGTDAVPDGSVVDAEGNLWNAQWDGWRMVRYGPDGSIRQVVELPVQRPTCPAFGGADMQTLYVASARVDLDDAALAAQPAAGALISFRAGTPGLPEPCFRSIAAAAIAQPGL